MLQEYFHVLVFFGVAVGMAVGMLGASYLVGVKRPDPVKQSPYECGFEPISRVFMRFDVRYYLVAILFIVFDIEAAFLFPWAVVFKEIGLVGFVEMLLFLAVLLVGYAYAWKKGALEWE